MGGEKLPGGENNEDKTQYAQTNVNRFVGRLLIRLPARCAVGGLRLQVQSFALSHKAMYSRDRISPCGSTAHGRRNVRHTSDLSARARRRNLPAMRFMLR